MVNIHKIQNAKYSVVKENVHLLKVKNKKAQDKISGKRNDLKEIAKQHLYSNNHLFF